VGPTVDRSPCSEVFFPWLKTVTPLAKTINVFVPAFEFICTFKAKSLQPCHKNIDVFSPKKLKN